MRSRLTCGTDEKIKRYLEVRTKGPRPKKSAAEAMLRVLDVTSSTATVKAATSAEIHSTT